MGKPLLLDKTHAELRQQAGQQPCQSSDDKQKYTNMPSESDMPRGLQEDCAVKWDSEWQKLKMVKF